MSHVEKYLRYLRYERNYSRHTEISYSTDLCQFEKFVVELIGEFVPENVDTDVVRRWVVSLMGQKISPRSVSRKLSSVKSFYAYLLEHRLVEKNPTTGVKSPRVNKLLPSFVNYSDMKPILDECFKSGLNEGPLDYEALLDHTIVELLYVTGMRREELIGLSDVDVDFFAKQLLVNGKRNKQRVIPFSSETAVLLQKYKDSRNKEVDKKSNNFFLLKTGQALYAMYVYRVVHRLLEGISTLHKASPHVLRHSFATSMLNNGAEINSVKELLGHASLASTEVYTHTSVEELKKIYEKAHPRA